MRVGLYQCEIGLRNNAPHLGAALVASDLARAGHHVDKALVDLHALADLPARIRAAGVELIGVDAIFPAPAVAWLAGQVAGVPIVVGGINALGSFLASGAPYAVVGQGRDAVVALVDVLARGGGDAALATVPNLVWRTAAGAIDSSPVRPPVTIEREITPFDPDFDWDYVGRRPRAAGANRHRLSVIAELGCPYRPDAAASPVYAGVPPAPTGPHDFTARAQALVRSHFAEDRRGCTFCVFRYQPYTMLGVAETVAACLGQYRSLMQRYGVHGVWLQSEAPLRFLEPFLDAVDDAGLALTEVTIRAFPAHLLARRDALFAALDKAARRQIRIALTEIGFENHSDAELALFNKGTTSTTNAELDELLETARRRYGAAFEGHQGHGMILLTPWTTFADLEANLAAARRMPYLARGLSADSRVVFYNEYVPIAAKAAHEGLLVRGSGNFGLDFRFADPRVGEFAGVLTALERILDDLGPAAAAHLDARLAAFSEALELARAWAPPEDKRRRFVASVRRVRALAGAPPEPAAGASSPVV